MRDFPINQWVALGMAAAFAVAAVAFKVPDGVTGHVVLGISMLMLGIVMFFLGWCGGGLAKFFAAASLWIGPNPAFLTFVAITLIGGGLYTLTLRALRGRLDAVPYLPVLLFALGATLPQAPIWHAIMGGVRGGV